MTFPPLPQPAVINGRMLFTAGDMREYGQACADAERTRLETDEYTKPQIPSPEVERLLGIFGMTK